MGGQAKWDLPLDGSLYLWVDAICINQDDIPERNKQVLGTDDIYEAATGVLIWLGTHVEHTELASNRLIEIEKEVNQLPKVTNPSILRRLGDKARRLIDENIPEDLEINVERVTRERLKDIVGRAWWRRTWILQEVVAYDKPLFFCGEFAMSKTTLSKYSQLSSISALNSGADAVAKPPAANSLLCR